MYVYCMHMCVQAHVLCACVSRLEQYFGCAFYDYLIALRQVLSMNQVKELCGE